MLEILGHALSCYQQHADPRHRTALLTMVVCWSLISVYDFRGLLIWCFTLPCFWWWMSHCTQDWWICSRSLKKQWFCLQPKADSTCQGFLHKCSIYHLAGTKIQFIRKVENKAFCTLNIFKANVYFPCLWRCLYFTFREYPSQRSFQQAL